MDKDTPPQDGQPIEPDAASSKEPGQETKGTQKTRLQGQYKRPSKAKSARSHGRIKELRAKEKFANLPSTQKEIIAVALAVAGADVAKTAELLDVGERQVERYRAKWVQLLPYLIDVSDYTYIRSDLISAVEAKALERVVTLLDRADNNLRDTVYALDILHRIGRLERNESTANLSTAVKHSSVVTLPAYPTAAIPSPE